MFPAFLAAFFFAASAILALGSTRLIGAPAANCARLWVASIILGCWAFSPWGSGLRGVALPIFIASGVVGFGMGDLGLFAALPRLGARLTALMVQCLASPLAALIEWLWLGTRLDWPEVVCAGLILAGVALAVAPDRRASRAAGVVELDGVAVSAVHLPGERGAGILFGWMAALGQAGGAVISRKAYLVAQAAGEHIDGATATWQRSLGGLVLVTTAFAISRRRARVKAAVPPAWRAAWPWIVANALVGATIGVTCYQWALSTTPSAIVLPIVALTPLLVIPFAYFIEHERPSKRSLAGGVLAVAGAIGLTLARLG